MGQQPCTIGGWPRNNSTRDWIRRAQRASAAALAGLLLGSGTLFPAVAQRATPVDSGSAAAVLNALYEGSGVLVRAPDNCVNDAVDPYADPAILAFCAIKEVTGALGGPPSDSALDDFVPAPGRFALNQPNDCDAVGAVADGRHDDCAVATGAATLLRAGSPVRLFGVCGRDRPRDCAALGSITDSNWTPAGVYLLMDPARVDVHCQYAQEAGRNGCNAGGAYTADQERPLCSEDAADPQCEFGADDTEAMLAAYGIACDTDPQGCLRNQVEARWGIDSVIAVGFMNRGDRPWDCEGARVKAERFAATVNDAFATDVPVVGFYLNVVWDDLWFVDAVDGCESPPEG